MKKSNYKERVKKTIRILKEKGYEIRFPGGKGDNGTFGIFGVIPRFNGAIRENELLMVPYNPRKSPQEVFPFPEETFEGESFESALNREVAEETGVTKGTYLQIGTFEAKNSDPTKTEPHMRYAYLIESPDLSNIRTRDDKFSKIKRPVWIPVSLLEECVWGNHRWIFDAFRQTKN